MPRARTTQRDAVRFGAIIRKMRAERGWTMKKFAHRADMSVGYLRFLEAGLNIPSLVTILHLAEVFEVDAGDLVREVALGRRRPAFTPSVPSIPLTD